MVTDVRRNVFPGDDRKEDDCYQFQYGNAIQAISSPSTSSSPGTSPTSVAGQILRKYRWMQAQHSPLSTTTRLLLLRKLEGGNDSIEGGSR